MTESLSPTQRKIIDAMKANPDRFASFDDAVASGVVILPAWDGGIIIRAPGNPEVVLEKRGLIEVVTRGVPGTWHRLTDNGRAA